MNYSVRNIVVAVGLAVCAVAAVLVYTGNVQSKAKNGEVRVQVLVAAHDIDAGTTFAQVQSGHMLRTETVTATDRLVGGLSEADLKSPGLANTVVSQKVYDGQQVPRGVLANPVGASADLQLQTYERAIAFPFDRESGLIGTLHAGDYVDVLACFNCADKTSVGTKPVTRVLLRNIQVLQVPDSSGTDTATSGQSQSTVMLKATDVEAAKLLWVEQNAKAWLVVRPRSHGENSDLNTTVQDEAQLLEDGLNAHTIKDLGLNAASLGSGATAATTAAPVG